ncbi:hypothetical protein [Bacillus licheniformis]|uniref:hypothetical protein n=1 Tax=Bacillus licheniformis TaxID=1402 RepID=UPI0011BFDE0B|nr:hypothetical protein [Bacillus licheniformis]TWJ43933.1 hypothetical protein CHCC5025_0251 [Bacillus licheniformis]
MNDIVKSSKDTLEKALKHMESYMQIKNDFLDNEFVQLLSESSKLVGFLRSSSELIVRKKFEAFLKGFSLDETPTEAQLERLIKYIDDETKAEFIADTFSKILLARSSKACVIMGSILNDVVENKDNLTHEHLTCINALMNFYDMDIENYKFLYDFLADEPALRKKWFGLSYMINEHNLNKSSIEITLEKSISTQIIQRGMELDIEDGEMIDTKREEYYVLTSSGKLLGVYLNRIFGSNLAE